MLGKSLSEAAEEIRAEAKLGLIELKQAMDKRDLSNLLKRCLSDRQVEKVEDFLNQSDQGERFMITNTRARKTVGRNSSRQRPMKKNSSSTIQNTEVEGDSPKPLSI